MVVDIQPRASLAGVVVGTGQSDIDRYSRGLDAACLSRISAIASLGTHVARFTANNKSGFNTGGAMANTAMSNESLERLRDAHYEVAPGEPDVRGWDVVLGDDQVIGKVDELIIDKSAGKVCYLEVDLNRQVLGLDRDRHVLVPISGAQLDTEEKEVVLSGMGREGILKLPEYDGRVHDREYDQNFRSHLSDDQKTKRITRSAEELRIGKRAEQKGEVRVSKHIETEHVRQTVPVRSEEVRVERRPVEHAVGSAAELRDDEVVVPVIEEEVIVEKRPVVKEELVISKEPTTVDRTIEADVRREEVDINPSSGNVRVKDDGMKGRGGE
jgi:uncharacterized protein (TIGR02271 family)